MYDDVKYGADVARMARYGTVWYDFILGLYCIAGPYLWCRTLIWREFVVRFCDFLLFVVVSEIVTCYLIFLRGSIADLWFLIRVTLFSSLFWLFVRLSVIFPPLFLRLCVAALFGISLLCNEVCNFLQFLPFWLFAASHFLRPFFAIFRNFSQFSLLWFFATSHFFETFFVQEWFLYWVAVCCNLLFTMRQIDNYDFRKESHLAPVFCKLTVPLVFYKQ